MKHESCVPVLHGDKTIINLTLIYASTAIRKQGEKTTTDSLLLIMVQEQSAFQLCVKEYFITKIIQTSEKYSGNYDFYYHLPNVSQMILGNTDQNKFVLDFKKMFFIKHKQLLIHYQYK